MSDAALGVRFWNSRPPNVDCLIVADFHGQVLPDSAWIVYKQQAVPMCAAYLTFVHFAPDVTFRPS